MNKTISPYIQFLRREGISFVNNIKETLARYERELYQEVYLCFEYPYWESQQNTCYWEDDSIGKPLNPFKSKFV